MCVFLLPHSRISLPLPVLPSLNYWFPPLAPSAALLDWERCEGRELLQALRYSFYFLILIHLFGCSESQLRHVGSSRFMTQAGSLVAACKLLIVAHVSSFLTRDQTQAPLHWKHSLNHWTTRELPK